MFAKARVIDTGRLGCGALPSFLLNPGDFGCIHTACSLFTSAQISSLLLFSFALYFLATNRLNFSLSEHPEPNLTMTIEETTQTNGITATKNAEEASWSVETGMS